jgi:hypothetical protein
MINKFLSTVNRLLGQLTEGTDNMLTQITSIAMNVVNVGIRFAMLMLLYQMVAADLPTVLQGIFN